MAQGTGTVGRINRDVLPSEGKPRGRLESPDVGVYASDRPKELKTVAVTELLDHLQHAPDCRALPAAGQPTLSPEHVVPDEVRAFYNLCGGVVIGDRLPYEVRIVGTNKCIPANAVILANNTLGDLADEVRDQLREDASRDWYIIAEVEGKWGLASSSPLHVRLPCSMGEYPWSTLPIRRETL